MFSNPFDTPENAVAKAKREREQLDRLLTISTSKELLLFGVAVAVLLCFAIWLWFGSIAHTLEVNGVLIESAQDASQANQSVRALIWIDSDRVSELEVGLPVTVIMGPENQSGKAIAGNLSGISTPALSVQIAEAISMARVILQQVDIELDAQFDWTSIKNKGCRIIIELSEQPPIVLLGNG